MLQLLAVEVSQLQKSASKKCEKAFEIIKRVFIPRNSLNAEILTNGRDSGAKMGGTYMKLKINMKFKDKYTGTNYRDGSIVEFEDERAKELLADKRNLVSEIEEVEKVEEVEEEKSGRKRKKSEK